MPTYFGPKWGSMTKIGPEDPNRSPRSKKGFQQRYFTPDLQASKVPSRFRDAGPPLRPRCLGAASPCGTCATSCEARHNKAPKDGTVATHLVALHMAAATAKRP